jgi:hypothetical protein
MTIRTDDKSGVGWEPVFKTDMIDYRKYYSLEDYIFDEVGPRFRKTGHIDPADFYLILIWKAERAKTRHKRRLAKTAGSFAAAVKEVAASLHAAPAPGARLKLLMDKWQFLLPTASAILTVLYPEEFTIYDWRVCDELGGFHEIAKRRVFSDELWPVFWADYQHFMKAVKAAAPGELSLRDADRYLWGRSVYRSINKELSIAPDAEKGVRVARPK